MRSFRVLLFHELRVAFLSPSTWVAWFLFLALMGFFYQGILQDFSRDGGRELLPPTQLYRLYWFPVVFIVPLLTMRSIAEERRLGTLANLFSTPISSGAFISAKFFASYLIYATIWFSTLLLPLAGLLVYPDFFRNPQFWDAPSLIGSLTFILLSGLLYIAIGIFTSSITRSQLVAGLLSFALLFIVLIGGKIVTEYPLWTLPWQGLFPDLEDYLQGFRHLEDFSRGVIDTRPFLFYTSFALLFLTISGLVVKAKS